MKAFEMKYDGETEYVCAQTMEEALKYYLSAWVEESDKEQVVCREVPESELEGMVITYYGEDCEDDESLPSETFKDYLRNATIVEKFCSTWDY